MVYPMCEIVSYYLKQEGKPPKVVHIPKGEEERWVGRFLGLTFPYNSLMEIPQYTETWEPSNTLVFISLDANTVGSLIHLCPCEVSELSDSQILIRNSLRRSCKDNPL